MKVLHVIPSVSPALGGPTQVVLNLVKALRECGVDAEIVTTNDDGPDLLDVPLNQRVVYQQVPITFLPRVSPRLKEYIFSAELTRWLWQHSREYDILDNHYLFSYASSCAGAIAKWQGVPYTVRTMGQLAPWALAQSRLKKQIYSSVIERRNLNSAAAIHCTSTGEAEDVRKFGIQTPTFTLPLGVEPPKYLPDAKQKLRAVYGIAPETPIVLFLSRLHYKKRPDLLLRAALCSLSKLRQRRSAYAYGVEPRTSRTRSLSQLATQGQDFHLILAGSGEASYLTELKNLASSLGLSAQTSFAGFVTGQDKQLLLQGADIFVLPSFSENFGVAVAEAMSHGLPVIVTPDVQIAPEIAAASAGLVVPGEVEAFADAITTLLTSPHLRHQLGENGKRLGYRRYSWNAIASKLLLAYSALIQKQSLPQFSGNLELDELCEPKPSA